MRPQTPDRSPAPWLSAHVWLFAAGLAFLAGVAVAAAGGSVAARLCRRVVTIARTARIRQIPFALHLILPTGPFHLGTCFSTPKVSAGPVGRCYNQCSPRSHGRRRPLPPQAQCFPKSHGRRRPLDTAHVHSADCTIPQPSSSNEGRLLCKDLKSSTHTVKVSTRTLSLSAAISLPPRVQTTERRPTGENCIHRPPAAALRGVPASPAI